MKKVEINETARQERLEVLKKIKEYETIGGDAFFNDVENDPPYSMIMPNDVDYEYKKFSTKIKRFFATLISKIWMKKVKKDFEIHY